MTGLLDSGLAVAYEQYIIDNEINGSVLRALHGFEVDEDRLTKNVIRKVGPGGNYLAEEHTVKYMRKEFYQPLIATRDNYLTWEANGSLDTRERARIKVRELLANHRPPVLPEEVKQQIIKKSPALLA